MFKHERLLSSLGCCTGGPGLWPSLQARPRVYFSLFLFLFFFLCGVGGMTCSASFSTSVWRQSFLCFFWEVSALPATSSSVAGRLRGWGHWLHSSDCCGRWYFFSLLGRSREVLYLVTSKLSFSHRYIAELFFYFHTSPRKRIQDLKFSNSLTAHSYCRITGFRSLSNCNLFKFYW